MIRGLEGVRVKAALRLVSPAGDALHETSGEALFTAEGVSGIAAMQLSRFATDGCTLMMNLTESLTGSPDTDVPTWLEERIRRRGHLPVGQLLTGSALPALQNALLSMAGIGANGGTPAQLTKSQQENLCRAITGFSLPVTGVRGFDAAQVTAGGIDPRDVDPATMESRLVPGLYLTGEILNVDGDCGGFNLLFAFASGLLSGKSL
jgi:predicted Rossmann fold flavoprotein